MARKKKPEEHVNHERWLISYADFITLLFAFFVVMFASSQVDSNKVGRFSESFKEATGIPVFVAGGKGVMPGDHDPQPDAVPIGDSDVPADDLRNLEGQVNKQLTGVLTGVKLIRRRHELVLRLPEGVLFGSGDDTLEDSAVRVLRAIGEQLRGRKVDIRVEGHTDNIPIKTARYRSNWELSTSRAVAVVTELATAGLDPVRLSAAGYGEFHPIASNSTPTDRGLNRRVDLVITLSGPVEKP
jgi:chemotaxis protein MotB